MPGIDFGLDRFGRRDPDPVMTVTQLTAAVKSAITSMPELSHVAVAGEISSCTRSAKGHIYITLKDGASVVSAVVFAGSARTLTHQPQVNEQVVCYGSVDVYGGQGRSTALTSHSRAQEPRRQSWRRSGAGWSRRGCSASTVRYLLCPGSSRWSLPQAEPR